MKNTQYNDTFSIPYDVGNVRIERQPNKVVRKVIFPDTEFYGIQEKISNQARPKNLSNIEKLSSSLRSKVVSGLASRYRQRNRRALQDNIDFVQEFNSIKQFYKFYEVNFVTGFLRKNRFLVPLLRATPEKIYDYFGKDQKLALKVSFDSDSPQLSELWVLILTELPAKDALPVLERFDEEWWLENMDRADCKLNITLKFV